MLKYSSDNFLLFVVIICALKPGRVFSDLIPLLTARENSNPVVNVKIHMAFSKLAVLSSEAL